MNSFNLFDSYTKFISIFDDLNLNQKRALV